MTKPSYTDWFLVLSELRRFGLAIPDVSAIICVPKGTVYGWKQGSEPSHSHGERLIELWVRVTSKSRECIPVVVAGDFRSYHTVKRPI